MFIVSPSRQSRLRPSLHVIVVTSMYLRSHDTDVDIRTMRTIVDASVNERRNVTVRHETAQTDTSVLI